MGSASWKKGNEPKRQPTALSRYLHSKILLLHAGRNTGRRQGEQPGSDKKTDREACTSKLAPDGPASLISLSTTPGVHGSGLSPTLATVASPGCRRAFPATEADGAYDGVKSLAVAVGGDTAAFPAAAEDDAADRGDGPCEEGGVKTFVEAADEGSFLEEEADEAWGDGVVA